MDIKILNGRVVKEFPSNELDKRIEIAQVDLQKAQQNLQALLDMKAQEQSYKQVQVELSEKKVPYRDGDTLETLKEKLQPEKVVVEREII